MKILTMTFFKDFARYFLYLENEIETRSNSVEYINISLYPCAHHYWLKNNKESLLLEEEVKKVKDIDFDIYLNNLTCKEIKLENIISFNYKSQLMYKLDKKEELKKQAIRYIYYFDQLFSENSIDLYISSGDSRMAIEIADIMAKRYEVKTFYFEQGPFGTTIMDEKGVNCNLSFLDTKEFSLEIDRDRLKLFISEYHDTKREKYWLSEKKSFLDRFYDLKTFYWMYPCRCFPYLTPVDMQIGTTLLSNLTAVLKNRFDKKKKEKEDKLPNKFVLFILQVPVDAQLIDNSPLYDDFFVMLRDIHKGLPQGYNLVVREHPNNLGKYDEKLYEYIAKQSNIYLVNNLSLKEVLLKSELVILNNSTVGIEALTYYKTVLTLGSAYYNREGVTYTLDARENLSRLLDEALKKPITKDSIDIFLYNFIFEYLIEGHFQDENLQNSKVVVDKLLKK